MNPTEPTDPDKEKKQHEAIELWTKQLPPDAVKDMRDPLEREILHVVEAETLKWDALKEIGRWFSHIADLSKMPGKNKDLAEDLKDVKREGAAEKIIYTMSHLVEQIDRVEGYLNEQQNYLGDLVSGILRHALDLMKERIEKMIEALNNIKTAIDNGISFGGEQDNLLMFLKEYDNFRDKYFYELSQTLNIVSDPFSMGIAEPFEKEASKNLLNALKVPAVPEGLLKKYVNQKNEKKVKFDDNFNEEYDRYLAEELQNEIDEISEEIDQKRKELEELKAKWENRTDVPQFTEEVMKEYAYWQNITPEKRFKELLRLRAFELTKPSAGDKKLPVEFMAKIYYRIEQGN